MEVKTMEEAKKKQDLNRWTVAAMFVIVAAVMLMWVLYR